MTSTTEVNKPSSSSYSFSLSFTSKFSTSPARASPAEVSSASSPFSNFRFSARPSSYAFLNAFATSSSLNLIAKNSSLVSPLKKRQKLRIKNWSKKYSRWIWTLAYVFEVQTSPDPSFARVSLWLNFGVGTGQVVYDNLPRKCNRQKVTWVERCRYEPYVDMRTFIVFSCLINRRVFPCSLCLCVCVFADTGR